MKVKEIPSSIYNTLKLKSLSAKKLREKSPDSLPVVVSLTSIPSRLKKVHITLRSILSQKNPPEKLVLWLNENDKDKIPESLLQLTGDVLSIQFSPLTCSHKKLIHTLEMYPDAIIVTSDDDLIYDRNWLSGLYKAHLKDKNQIIAHQTRQIQFDEKHNLLDYKKWNFNNPEKKKAVFAIGAGGVLYPPNCLDPRVADAGLFLKLAPKADDLWFKAMSLLKGTLVIQTPNPPKLIPISGTQKVSLKKVNVDQNGNVRQWQDLTDYFNLDID